MFRSTLCGNWIERTWNGNVCNTAAHIRLWIWKSQNLAENVHLKWRWYCSDIFFEYYLKIWCNFFQNIYLNFTTYVPIPMMPFFEFLFSSFTSLCRKTAIHIIDFTQKVEMTFLHGNKCRKNVFESRYGSKNTFFRHFFSLCDLI